MRVIRVVGMVRVNRVVEVVYRYEKKSGEKGPPRPTGTWPILRPYCSGW